MPWTSFFEFVGQAVAMLVAGAAAWWGFERWRRRDEHFPRIELEVTARIVGVHAGRLIVEVAAIMENKGVVPLEYKRFTFKIRGLSASDLPTRGDASIRGQLAFPHVLAEGSFIPAHWPYSFVYPGVRTEYNFVTDLPLDMPYLRVQADLDYMMRGESHHAARIINAVGEPTHGLIQGGLSNARGGASVDSPGRGGD